MRITSFPRNRPSMLCTTHVLGGRTSSELSKPPAKRARKERMTNWSMEEVRALIVAKRRQYKEENKVLDRRHSMTPDALKWLRISVEVIAVAPSES